MIDPRTVNRVAAEYEARIAAIQASHAAAISRAREEARREALEEVLCLMYERDDVPWSERLAAAIRALIPNTPQGETKEQQP